MVNTITASINVRNVTSVESSKISQSSVLVRTFDDTVQLSAASNHTSTVMAAATVGSRVFQSNSILAKASGDAGHWGAAAQAIIKEAIDFSRQR
jgi:hypothetical protein